MRKKILVTGGAGYVGSHTCKLLFGSGYEPITYDNLSTGYESAVKWGPLIKGDLRDENKLINTLKMYQPEAVIHFAASAYVGESVLNPLKYYQNNVGSTLALLNAMSAVGLRKIVFSSTCATYGVPEDSVIKESCPQLPINPYGQSKLMIEKILGDMAGAGLLDQISLRYFNAAGADRECEIGEQHDPETHLIPLAIQSGFSGKAPLKIFGIDFPTQDGTAVRDFIHVEDLGKAHILALERLISGPCSDFINLGTGIGSSVREILNALIKLGIPVKSVDAPRRLGDPPYLVADANRAKAVLNWSPEYLNIEDLLSTAVAWHAKKGF